MRFDLDDEVAGKGRADDLIKRLLRPLGWREGIGIAGVVDFVTVNTFVPSTGRLDPMCF